MLDYRHTAITRCLLRFVVELEWWRDERASGQHFGNRGGKIGSHPSFDDIAAHADGAGGADEFDVLMKGQQHHGRAMLVMPQPPGDLEAIQIRHGNIQHDDVWIQAESRFQPGVAVESPPDDVVVVSFEQRCRNLEKFRIVVDQQHT